MTAIANPDLMGTAATDKEAAKPTEGTLGMRVIAFVLGAIGIGLGVLLYRVGDEFDKVNPTTTTKSSVVLHDVIGVGVAGVGVVFGIGGLLLVLAAFRRR